MKVLLINGSPNKNGSTFTALNEVASTLNDERIETEIFHIGKNPIQGCIGCHQCLSTGKCVFEDDVVSAAKEKTVQSDGFVFGSPVYYAAATGQMTAFMNRLFFSNKRAFSYKPAAAVVCCRRAGSTAALEQLNKYHSGYVVIVPVGFGKYCVSATPNCPKLADLIRPSTAETNVQNLRARVE